MIERFQALINDTQFNVGDGAAGGITVAAMFQVLPYISAALSIIWMGLRIYVLIRDEIINKEKKDGDK